MLSIQLHLRKKIEPNVAKKINTNKNDKYQNFFYEMT